MSNKINRMFSDISKNYDMMNSILSLGFDRVWRIEASKEAIINKKRYRLIDIACGTGKLSMQIEKISNINKRFIEIIGIDFDRDMLNIAKIKSSKQHSKIKFRIGDALKTDYKHDYFDVLTTSFALRDFDSIEKFAKEAKRILKKNGKLIILEMAKPDRGIMKYLFRLYFKIMKLEGIFIDRKAYEFLVESISTFDKNKLKQILEKEGFVKITLTELPSKVAFMLIAYKK